ncbi:hypothetical protein ACO22_06874 [Paracoccidioides brasiliensis]|uniref:Uncharacterized protein n=1 Tax=Paracoccidioides brasiliensis TaxID=121759 RepID=A0A1D2J679_PARBR|nr:hypothetical protein ACO22_06874 [Paracoccidioides brasiliensis]
MSNEASIQLALEDLRLQEVPNYLATAKNKVEAAHRHVAEQEAEKAEKIA